MHLANKQSYLIYKRHYLRCTKELKSTLHYFFCLQFNFCLLLRCPHGVGMRSSLAAVGNPMGIGEPMWGFYWRKMVEKWCRTGICCWILSWWFGRAVALWVGLIVDVSTVKGNCRSLGSRWSRAHHGATWSSWVPFTEASQPKKRYADATSTSNELSTFEVCGGIVGALLYRSLNPADPAVVTDGLQASAGAGPWSCRWWTLAIVLDNGCIVWWSLILDIG